jgi:DDE superfamily endonuclease
MDLNHDIKLKVHPRHGEAAAVDQGAVETDLAQIQRICNEYKSDNIYKMDETSNYWKAMPDRTLSSEQLAGGERSKSRITANLCCNSNWSYKLPIWFIGTAKKARGFRGISFNVLSCVLRPVASQGRSAEQLPTNWLNRSANSERRKLAEGYPRC